MNRDAYLDHGPSLGPAAHFRNRASFPPGAGANSALAAFAFVIALAWCNLGALSAAGAEPISEDWSGIVNPPYQEARKAASKTYIGADPAPALKGTNFFTKEFLVTVVAADSGKPVSGARITSFLGADDWQHIPIRKTDENGRYIIHAAVPLALLNQQNNHSFITVSASHRDFAPGGLNVSANYSDLMKSVSTNVDIKLEKGVPVGGRVVDDRGNPVAGAKALISATGIPQEAYSATQTAWTSYPGIGQTDDPDSDASVTAADGTWTYAHFPAGLQMAEITIISPDGARASFGRQAPAYQNMNPPVDFADLMAGKAIFTLKTGFVVHGVVVDDAGKPIAGAIIREGYGLNNHIVTSIFLTDSRGRFERVNRVKRQWIYTASAPGKAIGSAIANVNSNAPPVKIVLQPEKPLTIKVTDADQKPVAGATVAAEPWRNQGQILDWSVETDAAGAVTWTNRPLTKLNIAVTSPTLGNRLVRITPGETVKTIDFRPATVDKVSIKLDAIDADTKKPVRLAKIQLRVQEWMPARTLAEPNAETAVVNVAQGDLQGNSEFSLRVEAEGYAPLTLKSLDFGEGDQSLEAAMKAAKPIDIQIVDFDGAPAADARCWVKTQEGGQQLYMNGSDQFFGQEAYEKPKVGPDGKARLPLAPDDSPVIAVTQEGVGTSTLGRLRANPVLNVEAFGKIRGTCYIGTNVGKGVSVNLQMLIWSQSNPIQVSFGAATRPDGRFEFNKVPPGEYKLVRFRQHMGPMTESHAQPITVKAGQTLEVKYGGVGRLIVGQAQAAPDDVSVDWKNDDHSLSRNSGPSMGGIQLNADDYATMDAWNEALRLNNGGGVDPAAARSARSYVLDFDDDGGFRADDVEPGTYTLNIVVTKPKKRQEDYWNRRPDDEIGALHKEIVIPEGPGEFDIGSLVVPVRGSPAAGGSAIALKASDLDGKPWDLDSLRGKTVVLCIWASWSERSSEMFKAWPKLVDDYGKDGRVSFVGVALGESASVVKSAAQERGYTWPQVVIDGKPAIEWLDRYNINELPYCVIIGPDGKSKGAGVEPRKVAVAIAKLTRSKP